MTARPTLAELQAAGKRANAIEAAISEYWRAKDVLAQVNKFVKSNQVWRPELRLTESWNGPTVIKIAIPGGVIQQQAVYAVDAARRKIVSLGGDVPADKVNP